MKKIVQVVFLLFVTGVAAPNAWSASPCSKVDQGLTEDSKNALAPVIATQLHAKKVDVLQSFRFGGWTILYVASHEADDAFLFYSRDPLRSSYITMWGGAATYDEESGIRDWTLKNAPGIPLTLAHCFAWHVTKDRNY